MRTTIALAFLLLGCGGSDFESGTAPVVVDSDAAADVDAKNPFPGCVRREEFDGACKPWPGTIYLQCNEGLPLACMPVNGAVGGCCEIK